MPFTKGNTLAKGKGRPKKSLNLLPLIRERVLTALNKRITIDKMLSKIDDIDLLKFAQSIMPKDISVKHSADVQYISHTPRPAQCITLDIQETKESIVIEETKNNSSNSNNDNDSLNNIDNLYTISNDSIGSDHA